MVRSKNYRISSYIAISLEELLIGLLLSSVLLVMIFQFYGIIKLRLNNIEQNLELIYKYQVADFFIKNNIIQAGYKGPASCLIKNSYNTIAIIDNQPIVPLSPIAVCKPIVSVCKKFVPHKIINKIRTHQLKPESDILLIYDVPVKTDALQESMLDYNSSLKISEFFQQHLNLGDQLIIADLQTAQRFSLSNIIGDRIIHSLPYNFTEQFSKKFEVGSEIILTRHLAFYLAKDPQSKLGLYKLYMDYFNSEYNYYSHAILDQVEDLQVQVVPPQSKELVDASEFGWILNKYILINLRFKHHDLIKTFVIGVELRNV